MLDRGTSTLPRRRSSHPPFPRILCAVDGGDASDAAIQQAIAFAGDDARVAFAVSWYGTGSPERAAEADQRAREVAEEAVAQARTAGVQARADSFHAPRLGEALLGAAAANDLVVVGAHSRETDDAARHGELQAELANARALLGRPIDYVKESGPAARAIVLAAEGDGAGLVVLGSSGRTGLRALTSVSERVAHLAPCSVLVMRGC